MSSMRHGDSDGSDIFWPGYVDAVTNLVLNLLFLLTIMTVAVFMFALELGRASMGAGGKTPSASAGKTSNITQYKVENDQARKENLALKKEIERLNIQLAQQKKIPRQQQNTLIEKQAEATATIASTQTKPAKTIATSDTDVLVRFTEDAIAFTQSERGQIMNLLKPIVNGGRASILVDVPKGFSETKRLGFYRAMSVRNLLIEMKMPKEMIDVKVREVKTSSNPSVVKVRGH